MTSRFGSNFLVLPNFTRHMLNTRFLSYGFDIVQKMQVMKTGTIRNKKVVIFEVGCTFPQRATPDGYPLPLFPFHATTQK